MSSFPPTYKEKSIITTSSGQVEFSIFGYTKVFESISIPALELDENAIIRRVNNFGAVLFGKTPRDLEGRSLDMSMLKKESQQIEIRVGPYSGTLVTITRIAFQFADKYRYILLFDLPVDRSHLQKQESGHPNWVKYLPDIEVIELTKDLTIKSIPSSSLRRRNVDPSLLLGGEVRMLYPPSEESRKLIAQWVNFLSENDYLNTDCTQYGVEGAFMANLRVIATRNREGEITGYTHIVAEKSTGAVFTGKGINLGEIAMVSIDKRLYIQSMNNFAERLFGCSAEESMNLPFERIIRTEWPEGISLGNLWHIMLANRSWKGIVTQYDRTGALMRNQVQLTIRLNAFSEPDGIIALFCPIH